MFHKAIERAEPADEVKERVKNLINSITYSIYMYTTRGLFERDKLIFTSQVTFQVWLVDVCVLRFCILIGYSDRFKAIRITLDQSGPIKSSPIQP